MSGFGGIDKTGGSGGGSATETKQDDQLAKMPDLIAGAPLGTEFSLPVRQVGAASVSIVDASPQLSAVTDGGAGLPVRTNLDGRLPDSLENNRLKISLGLTGEFGDQFIGTEAGPIAIRGSDGVAFQQLALEHTRPDDYNASRITDGTDFIIPATETTLGQISSNFPIITLDGTMPVRADQGTATGASGRWPVQHTDGTNFLPTADVPARSQFHRWTDGTNTAAVKAASTAAQAIDPSGVIALSPNSPLPAGTNAIGHIDGQGSAGSPAGGVLSVQGVASGTPQPISDASGSLTIDAPVGTPVAVRVSNGTTFVSPALDHTGAADFNSSRLTDGSSFYKAAVAGDNLGADLRVSSASVSNSNPVPISDSNSSLTIDAPASTPVAIRGSDGSVFITLAQEHTAAASPHAARLSDGSAFYKTAVAGDNMGADLRVASAVVSNSNPVPISDAAGSLTIDAPVGTPVAVRISNGTSFVSPSLDHTGASDFNSSRLTDGSSFYKAVVAGDNLGADLRVAAAAVSNSNPVPISDSGASLTVDAPVGTPVAVRVSNGTTFVSPALEHVAANDFHSVRLTTGLAFYTAAQAGDNMGADLRVSSAAVTISNPAFVKLSDGAAALGTTTNPFIITNQTKPTFVAMAASIAPGNNKSMISLASTSGVYALREIYIVNTQTASITGVNLIMELRRFTSHSGGTSIIIDSYDSADAVPGGATAITNATITGGSTRSYRRWVLSSDEYMADAAEFSSDQVTLNNSTPLLHKVDSQMRPLTIRSGEGMYVICTTNTTVGTFDVTLIFTQES